jgi:hypothetical protein
MNRLLPMSIVVCAVVSFAAPSAFAQIRTVKGCKTRVVKVGKRRACVACIKRPRPHQFFKVRGAGKRCVPFKLVGAKVARVGAKTGIRLPAGCKAKVVKPAKRAACKACVKRPNPHAYFKFAKAGNRCKRLVAAAKIAPRRGGGGIRKAVGCIAKVVKPGKKKACVACVARPRPHAYFKMAKQGNRCKLLVR